MWGFLFFLTAISFSTVTHSNTQLPSPIITPLQYK